MEKRMKFLTPFLMLSIMFMFQSCQKDDEITPGQVKIKFSALVPPDAGKDKDGTSNQRLARDYFQLSHFIMRLDGQLYETADMDEYIKVDYDVDHVISKFDVFDTDGNLVYALTSNVTFRVGLNDANNDDDIINVPVSRPQLQANPEAMSSYFLDVESVTVPLTTFRNGNIVTSTLYISLLDKDGVSTSSDFNVSNETAGSTITLPVPEEGATVMIDFYYMDASYTEWFESITLPRSSVIRLRNLEIDFIHEN